MHIPDSTRKIMESKPFDNEIVRSKWVKSVEGEIWVYLSQIRKKKATIKRIRNRGSSPALYTAELVFNISVLVNYLAHVDLKESGNVGAHRLTEWLQSNTDWPEDVCFVFWKAVRNPTMHIGRTDISIWIDPKPVKNSTPRYFSAEFIDQDIDSTSHPENGYQMIKRSDNKTTVLFFYNGLYAMMDELGEKVTANVKSADRDDLSRLRDLNFELLPHRHSTIRLIKGGVKRG